MGPAGLVVNLIMVPASLDNSVLYICVDACLKFGSHPSTCWENLIHFGSFILPQDNIEWMDWQTDILNERNTVENVYRWACGQVFLYHLIRSLLMNNTS